MNLPEDVLMEILVRLPIKSLLKFRCVCKAWCALIKSIRFIDMHLSRSKIIENYVVLVKRFIEDDSKTILSFHAPDDDESESLQVLAPDLEVPVFNEINSHLVAHCDGIVCITNFSDIYLCNPATREFRKLPARPFGSPEGLQCSMHDIAFGFDETTSDYKLVKFVAFLPAYTFSNDFRNFTCKPEIYNLSTNGWREMDAKFPGMTGWPYNLLFNGCFHWHAVGENASSHILSLDLSSEVFREIKYPNGVGTESDRRIQNLVVLHDSLALILCTSPVEYAAYTDQHDRTVEEQFIDIWVMMDYGVQESWMKRYCIGPLSGIHYPIASLNNDGLLVEIDNGQLASCALLNDGGRLKKYNVCGATYSLQAVTYKESLVSLNERNDQGKIHNTCSHETLNKGHADFLIRD